LRGGNGAAAGFFFMRLSLGLAAISSFQKGRLKVKRVLSDGLSSSD
jgi:hypothetical protein